MDKAEAVASIIFASHALARIATTEMRDETPAAQWRVLSILRSQGPQRVGAMAKILRTAQPGITRLIGELATAGLVTRDSDPDDSRATVVRITPEGNDALVEWRGRLATALGPHFSDLTPEEWATLTRAADLLVTRTRQSLHTTGDNK